MSFTVTLSARQIALLKELARKNEPLDSAGDVAKRFSLDDESDAAELAMLHDMMNALTVDALSPYYDKSTIHDFTS